MIGEFDAEAMAWVVAQQEIRDVCFRYCRGIDRRNWDLVRRCYHPDATDHHGDYQGDVDGFLVFVEDLLKHFEQTTHFLGNMLIERSGPGVRSETYAIAMHRIAARGDKPARDLNVGLRYVDDFAHRDGEWRIARRVAVVDWSRSDLVHERGSHVPEGYIRGRSDSSDLVFRPFGALPSSGDGGLP